MVVAWERAESVFPGLTQPLVTMHPIWWYRIQTTVILTTGTILLMWMGEQITDRGIGNGVSLIITVNIAGAVATSLPKAWLICSLRVTQRRASIRLIYFISSGWRCSCAQWWQGWWR